MIILSFLLAGLVNAEPVGEVNSDGEIAQVLMTLNAGEVEAAKKELRNGRNSEARSYAQMMEGAHIENNTLLKKMASARNLNAKPSELNSSLDKEAKKAIEEIRAEDKASFDRSYVISQVKMHQMALNLIDDKLLPKVQNPELKDHLQKTRAAVSSHLEQAKSLQNRL